MKISTLIISASLTIASASCNGQGRQEGSRTAGIRPSGALAANDTVATLDKSILVVFQARNGNYWFGSDTVGIFRYDGKTIVHFVLKGGLWNNRVRGIQEDSTGNVYFTTTAGITRYDGQAFTALTVAGTETFKNQKPGPRDLWFKGKPGENGVYRYDGKKLYHLEFPKHPMEDGIYARAHPPPPYNPHEVYTIYKDRRGAVWFGTATLGIYRYDGVSLSGMYEKHLTDIEGGGSFGIRSILEDRTGKFWFCNTRYRYDISADGERGTGAILYKREPGIADYGGDSIIYFMSILEDDSSNLWMATYGQGVWRYDGEKMTQYLVTDGVKPVNVYSIYKDKQGALWLGTHNSGAYRFNGRTFEKFKA